MALLAPRRAAPFTHLLSAGLLLLSACRPMAGEPRTGSDRTLPSRLDREAIRHATQRVDDARLRGAADERWNWLTHGGTYAETRFSPLDQIHDGNVSALGLAWHFDTGSRRGLEATPIVVDGILYTTGAWSVVYCVDGRTGALLWTYDPQVPPETGAKACCDVVNRGVALYRGRVYVGTLDGRLVALDAATGAVVWERVTVDRDQPYTITGAPRVVKGKVIIGNGGADYGVRGYVSAYDAESGALVWRTYTVPGDPAQPFESPALARAAATWSGRWWEMGGGGTVWDSISYDPQLDLLYVGTGNGSPWNRQARSPGGGDNLYLSSILALRPDSGELVWHYQTTPGDTWDYTATQQMILTELLIDGRPRPVLLQAPKNGFFYVLDRATGELLSAAPFVEVTWAKGVDLRSGRPIEVPGSDFERGMVEVRPSQLGGHNWHPMSFNPRTGFVYLAAQEVPQLFAADPSWRYRPGVWNTGIEFAPFDTIPPEYVSGHLLAWDPIAQREVWRVQYPGPWNGGTLTTAGNLVFQGTANGAFAAYRATDGALLWEAPAGTGVVAGPITYAVDGVQYVAVMAGWGGIFPLLGGDAAAAAGVRDNTGRLLSFRLDGTLTLPAPRAEVEAVSMPAEPIDPRLTARGKVLYQRWCARCHGVGAVSGGVLRDLRRSESAASDALADVVLRGTMAGAGMPSFERWIDARDVETIRHYLLARRAELAARQNDPTGPPDDGADSVP